MSGTAATISELTRPAAAGPPRPAALPYLSVADARAAIDWYTNAFDAVVIGEPIVMADGRIGHAEIAIGDGVLYLADEYPEYGLKAPAPQAVSVSLMLHVVDADATLQKARDHGAVVEREPYENHRKPYGDNHRPVRPPLAAVRASGDACRRNTAWGYRVRVGMDPGRRTGRRFLRPRPGLGIRLRLAADHQFRAANRYFSQCCVTHPVLLLRGG